MYGSISYVVRVPVEEGVMQMPERRKRDDCYKRLVARWSFST